MSAVERLQAAIEKLDQWSAKPFWAEYADEVDALLHRTIDAQRVILVYAANTLVRQAPGFELSPQYRHALALADAILGGTE